MTNKQDFGPQKYEKILIYANLFYKFMHNAAGMMKNGHKKAPYPKDWR